MIFKPSAFQWQAWGVLRRGAHGIEHLAQRSKVLVLLEDPLVMDQHDRVVAFVVESEEDLAKDVAAEGLDDVLAVMDDQRLAVFVSNDKSMTRPAVDEVKNFFAL